MPKHEAGEMAASRGRESLRRRTNGFVLRMHGATLERTSREYGVHGDSRMDLPYAQWLLWGDTVGCTGKLSRCGNRSLAFRY